MKITFYAPLKPLDHPVPSGDRLVGGLLLRALRRANHDVTIASRFRSYDGTGDADRQNRIALVGRQLADRYLRRARTADLALPELWFTYHLYHKAPDYLGPYVADRLGIPYVAAEASLAPKQAAGRWATGHRVVEGALRAAAGVFGLSSDDAVCVRGGLRPGAVYCGHRPFLDLDDLPTRSVAHRDARADLAARLDLPVGAPILMVAAMMRPGDKAASYHLLARALSHPSLATRPWSLVVIGGGGAEAEVGADLRSVCGPRVRLLGQRPRSETLANLAAGDLFVWPAFREAFGMAILEAQALGLPVLAGKTGGVGDIVRDGETGWLVSPIDVDSLVNGLCVALDRITDWPGMGQRAAAVARRDHGMDAAARALDGFLAAACAFHAGQSQRKTRP